MTENYIILSAILVVIVIGLAGLLFRKKNPPSGEKKENAEKRQIRQDQPVFEEPLKDVRDLDRLIEILQKSVSLEDHVYRKRYVPMASGQPACIQAMYLGPRGMMIFRLISDEGWVLGDQDSRWWTFCVSSDERAYINNPIWECRNLIDSLKKFLPTTGDLDYHIGIVFSDRCEIRSVEVGEDVYIGNLRQFEIEFQELLSQSKPIYDVDMVENLAEIFAVMDDPDTVVERLKTLKHEMTVKQEAMLRQEMEIKERMKAEKEALSEERKLIQTESAQTGQNSPGLEERFTNSEIFLRDGLVIWRKQQADIEKVSVIEIFDNLTLDLIVDFKPLTLDALRKIPEFDEEKIDRYGKSIITMVRHAPI